MIVEMKSRLLISILFLAVFPTPMVSLALAQSNHTLEWGVSPGEEFTYVLQRAFYAGDNSRTFLVSQLPFLAQMRAGQKVLLEVNFLEEIASSINESAQLPRSYCSLLRENDSALIMSDLPSFVIPVGDWEFLNGIENITGTPGLTLIDTEDEWGTIGVGVISGSGGSDINVRIETRYEKENGTLSYLRQRYTTLGNDLIDVIFVQWHPGMPTIVGGGVQTTTLMIIAACGITGLTVAFIVYRMIKGKKPVIQQLGE
jgi:hypothetical protein